MRIRLRYAQYCCIVGLHNAAQNSHSTVVFPLILRTVVVAHTLSATKWSL